MGGGVCDLVVAVQCFDRYGTPADSPFSLMATTGFHAEGRSFGWSWGQPNNSPIAYRIGVPGYTSKAGEHSAQSSPGGLFQETFRPLQAMSSSAMVSASDSLGGDAARRCKIRDWGPAGPGTSTSVLCFDKLGNPVQGFVSNHTYNLSYTTLQTSSDF